MKTLLRICLCAAAVLAITAASAAEGPRWTPSGDLNAARLGHTATLLSNGHVLVTGGMQAINGPAQRTAEVYDAGTGSWIPSGEMGAARAFHTATRLNDGRVLVVGGDGSGLPGEATTAELFDPAKQTWIATGNLNTPRLSFTATLLPTGEVLVAGGVDLDDATLRSAELYDPRTGTWTYTGSLADPRFAHTATALNDGRVLVVAGVADDFFGTQLSSAELYDPGTRSWQRAGYLGETRAMHTATLLPDGRVLVSGGNHRGSVPGSRGITYFTEVELGDSKLFDPVTGRWSAAQGLASPRYGHTSTLLRGGDVLVTGGVRVTRQIPNFATEHLRASELFAAYDLAWSGAPPLTGTRTGYTATLLRNGRVLIAGGRDNGSALRSTELYHPDSCDKNHFILNFPCRTDAEVVVPHSRKR